MLCRQKLTVRDLVIVYRIRAGHWHGRRANEMQDSDVQEATRVERQRHFIRAMSKSIDGRPVTQSDCDLLDEIFAALLHGKDVSDLIGVKPPHSRRSADPIYIALHYLCLTKLMRQKAVVAWRIVGDTWGLKQRVVRWVIADNWVPALAMMEKSAAAPDTLLRLCEQYARGARPERRRAGSGPPPRSTSDSLEAT